MTEPLPVPTMEPSTATTLPADDPFQNGLQSSLVPNRRVPAWLMTCILHTLIFIVIALLLHTVNHGAGNVETRTGGIVLVDLQSETTEYLDEGDVLNNESQAAAESNPPPTAADLQLPPDLPGLSSSESPLSGTGDQIAESMPGVDSLLENSPSKLEIGGRVTTEVFGIKGTGSRFVYVFDRSYSMEGYEARPLLAARQQLLKSLDSLGDTNQFQIIFYNNETRPFRMRGEQAKMYFAEEKQKKAARSFVQSVRGEGGTDHIRALKFALSLSPDVIFLLTDAEGGMTPIELSHIADRNRSGAVINTIHFGIGRGSDRSLERLSREHGGQYVFKNIDSLKVEK